MSRCVPVDEQHLRFRLNCHPATNRVFLHRHFAYAVTRCLAARREEFLYSMHAFVLRTPSANVNHRQVGAGNSGSESAVWNTKPTGSRDRIIFDRSLTTSPPSQFSLRSPSNILYLLFRISTAHFLIFVTCPQTKTSLMTRSQSHRITACCHSSTEWNVRKPMMSPKLRLLLSK